MIPPQVTFWSDEANVAALAGYAADGLSAGQIARAFNHQVSRNAVIGKIHRLGLQLGRNRGWQPDTPRPKISISKPKPVVVMLIEPEPIGPMNSFPDSTKQCQMPMGGVHFQSCGQPTARNQRGKMTSYCEYHRKVVYIEPKRKNDDHRHAPTAHSST